MNTNDLILGFVNDPRAMRGARAIVTSVFEIHPQDFDVLLYGALTKAWQSWDEHLSSFNTHVITCLKSECLDFRRKANTTPTSIEYADKVAVGVDPAHHIYMKATLEIVLEKILDHEDGDMLFRVLVCGENYAVVCENPANARKAVERFRAALKEEFGDIFN